MNKESIIVGEGRDDFRWSERRWRDFESSILAHLSKAVFPVASSVRFESIELTLYI
jgi:hypothetical protein